MKKLFLLPVAAVIFGLFSTSMISAADCHINVALSSNGSVASQKDNPFGLGPSSGNDGFIVKTTAFAHTGNADNEWWEVNLGAAQPIKEVRIWLRSDSAAFVSRDANLRLVVYDRTVRWFASSIRRAFRTTWWSTKCRCSAGRLRK